MFSFWFMLQFIPLRPERGLILEVEPLPFVHLKVSAEGPLTSPEKLPGRKAAALWLLSARATIGLERVTPGMNGPLRWLKITAANSRAAVAGASQASQ